MRIGFASDIHRLQHGNKLMLGGVNVPHWQGEVAHSDGDVVYHALAESILGALALGDLGKHFPDNDPEYKDISSLILLDKVVEMMKEQGFKIANIDIQVACKSPKLSIRILKMREMLAKHLLTSISNVSIKACSYNETGPIGKGEAIKASSYVLLEK